MIPALSFRTVLMWEVVVDEGGRRPSAPRECGCGSGRVCGQGWGGGMRGRRPGWTGGRSGGSRRRAGSWLVARGRCRGGPVAGGAGGDRGRAGGAQAAAADRAGAGAAGRAVSREVARNSSRAGFYRATAAQYRAEARARRPKTAKLAGNEELRGWVLDKLRKRWWAEQVSRRLAAEFPRRPEMQVPHETLYQSIYVQGRGALRRDPAKSLRTGRALRKPRRKEGERRGRIAGMVNSSERPAEAADRAVPGHWEGDLLAGRTASPRRHAGGSARPGHHAGAAARRA